MRKLSWLVASLLMMGLATARATTITNLAVTAQSGTTATIQWTTNVASSSLILYGIGNEPIQYSTVLDSTLVLTHTVTLSGVVAGTSYSYEAQSVDAIGNAATSAAQVFTVCNSAGLTNVSGTVNNYYEYGEYSLTWVNTSGWSVAPTLCGAPLIQSYTGSLDRGASLAQQLPDTQQIVPSPSQWELTVTGVDGSIGSFSVQQAITPNGNNLTTALQAGAIGNLLHVWYDPATSVVYPPIGSLVGILIPLHGGTGTSTIPTAAQILIGTIGGIYAPQTVTGDIILTAAGVTTVANVNGVSYPASPSTNTVPVVTAANTVTYEAVPNVALANSATTVNGQSCTLGSSCTVTAVPGGTAGGDLSGSYPNPTVAKINGVTLPTLAAATGLLYDTAGVLSLQSTLPTAAEPAHSGDVTNTAGSLAMTVVGIKSVTVPTLATGYLYYNGSAYSWTNSAVITTATNLAGGVLGSVPYQSAPSTTVMLAPNTSTTKEFYTQTGTGSVGAIPAWSTLVSSDLTTALTTPPAIGGTTPNTGAFSTLTDTGLTVAGYVTNTSGGLLGTVTTIPNAGLTNSSTSVNGQTCTLGSTCTVTAAATGITVGTTTVSSGTNGYILYDNGGVLDNTTTPSVSTLTSTVATGTAPFTVASTTAVGNLNASLLLGYTWASPGAIGSTTPNTGVFTTVTGQKIGAIYQVDQFTGSGAAEKINACFAAAITAGGGVCDAQNITGTQVMDEEIDVGTETQGSSNIAVALLLPINSVWEFNITDGISCGIKQFNNTSIWAPGATVNGHTMLLAPYSNATSMDSLYCTDPSPTEGGNYIKVSDFYTAAAYGSSAGIFANGTVHIQGSIFDESDFHNIFAGALAIPYAYGNGGTCTTAPIVGFVPFGGILQSAFVMNTGAGCGTGTGVTWAWPASIGNGTGATFNVTWSGGALATTTLTAGGSGYPASNLYGWHIDLTCCGTTFKNIGGMLKFGTDELVTGVTTTTGINIAQYTGITTDNSSKLIGMTAYTFDNASPAVGSNVAYETFNGATITAITGSTITLSANAVNSTTNNTMELRIASNTGGGASATSVIASSANKYYSLPGVPNVFVGGTSFALTFNDTYMEKNQDYADLSSSNIYVGSRTKDVEFHGVYCANGDASASATRPCIYNTSGSFSAAGVYPLSGNIIDKYYGTIITPSLETTVNNGYIPQTTSYSNLTYPLTKATFTPSTVGWYRIYDTSTQVTSAGLVSGSLEISQLGFANSVWDFISGNYAQPSSLTVQRTLYDNSTWGSITKVEISKSNTYRYIDVYVANTTTTPVIITFSGTSLQGGAIVPVPVVGAVPPSDSTAAIIDLTTLQGVSPTARTGSTTYPSSEQADILVSTVTTGTAPLIVASTTAVANLNASLLLGSTWASPGTIGSTTPNTGVFTTLNAGQPSLNNAYFGGAGNLTGTGTTNTASGSGALHSVTTGGFDSAFGEIALYFLTTGNSNSAVGVASQEALVDGNNNVSQGGNSLTTNVHGNNNSAFGLDALQYTTGSNNVAIGFAAGRNWTGSNAFFVNNTAQSSSANDQAYSLLYGTFSGTAGSLTGQQLTVNGTLTDSSLTTAGYVTNTSIGLLGTVATIPNAGLTNASTTVNGQTCTLGSTCTVTATVDWTSPGTIGSTTPNTGVFTTLNAGQPLLYNAYFGGAGNLTGTGSYNSAIGASALVADTTGSSNTGTGDLALQYNTTGSTNTATGYAALAASTTGGGNTAMGVGAGFHWTGSNAFFVNNIIQSSSANDQAYSLLYGTFSGTAGSLTGQQLTVNGALTVASGRRGTFACTAAGTITIANTNYVTGSDVTITMYTAGGTITTSPAFKTVTSGTGFSVLCGATDTSVYQYTVWN